MVVSVINKLTEFSIKVTVRDHYHHIKLYLKIQSSFTVQHHMTLHSPTLHKGIRIHKLFRTRQTS